MKVMFVCTGNICRSPMAEAIFRDLAGDVEVSSAGTFALDGEMASFNAIETCKNHGLDLSGHRSTPVEGSDIGDYLKRSYPHLKIHTIREYAGYDDLDIADPYGYNLNVYENCFLEIKEALEKICEAKFVR